MNKVIFYNERETIEGGASVVVTDPTILDAIKTVVEENDANNTCIGPCAYVDMVDTQLKDLLIECGATFSRVSELVCYDMVTVSSLLV